MKIIIPNVTMSIYNNIIIYHKIPPVYKKERIEEMVSDVERMLLAAIEDEKNSVTIGNLMEG